MASLVIFVVCYASVLLHVLCKIADEFWELSPTYAVGSAWSTKQ